MKILYKIERDKKYQREFKNYTNYSTNGQDTKISTEVI